MKKYWKHIKTEEQYKDKIISVNHRTVMHTKINRSMPFTIINTKDWVIIIPKINNKYTLVKQYRVATNEVTLEFPGGAINDNEDIKQSALRELKEETGLITDTINYLGKISPNPAILSNCCHVFFADNCKKTGKTNFDLFEDIEFDEYTLEEIEEMIKNSTITHSLVIAAYGLFKLKNV